MRENEKLWAQTGLWSLYGMTSFASGMNIQLKAVCKGTLFTMAKNRT